MSMTDPIADMLTRIRNANRALHDRVDIPASRVKVQLARILNEEGFIRNYRLIEGGKQGVLRLYLKYGPDNVRVITDIQRVSRPGLRVYAGVTKLPRVRSGLGVAIVSTSKGLMTDRAAREGKVGGEVLCAVW
ncbi:MAG: 30S ribosomal protein S8 [candidate division NC10 bacterium]|jgi:small subunit ribosomal protein S8|nr:30S ribosomal protein S8 [candidate division NC10 bacterium]MBI4413787.1 30S ribosomal protein S8 [candidate division NC10 bacterium]